MYHQLAFLIPFLGLCFLRTKGYWDDNNSGVYLQFDHCQYDKEESVDNVQVAFNWFFSMHYKTHSQRRPPPRRSMVDGVCTHGLIASRLLLDRMAPNSNRLFGDKSSSHWAQINPELQQVNGQSIRVSCVSLLRTSAAVARVSHKRGCPRRSDSNRILSLSFLEPDASVNFHDSTVIPYLRATGYRWK